MPLPIHFKGSPHCSLVEKPDVFFCWLPRCRRQLNAGSLVSIAIPHLIRLISLRPNPAPSRMCMTLKTREIMFVMLRRWQKCKTLTSFCYGQHGASWIWERRTDLSQITQISEKDWGYASSIPRTPVLTSNHLTCVGIKDEDKVGLYGGWSLTRLNRVFFFCGFVLFYFVGFNPWRIKTKLLIFLTVGIIYRETTINIYRSLWLKYRLVTFHITVQDYLGSCASLCDVLGVPMAVSYVKPFPETRKDLLVCVPWRMWPVL